MLKKMLVLPLIVLSMVACQGSAPEGILPQVEQSVPTIQEEEVHEYLAVNVGAASFGGKVFCAYEELATEQDAEGTTLYLWALCIEYYQDGGGFEQGTGVSVPVAIFLRNREGSLVITEHKGPGSGTDYGKDVRSIFPQSSWPEILPSNDDETAAYNLRAEMLESETEEMARRYFQTSD
jgi:hypothetical protein